MTSSAVWTRHGNHIVLTLTIRLAGVDGPWLRHKLGLVVSIKTGPAAELLSWQQHNRCCFVSFVINISGAKFEKHCFHIFRDNVHSVFCYFSCTPYDIITFLIWHNRKTSISLKIFQKGKCHYFFFWKACQISSNYFSCHRHFKCLAQRTQHNVLSNITR